MAYVITGFLLLLSLFRLKMKQAASERIRPATGKKFSYSNLKMPD